MSRLLRLAPLTALLLLSGVVWAGPPPAGTVITSTATATYTDQASGQTVHLNSNTADITVTALEALTLTASQTLAAPLGAPFTFSHVLTNTGNATTNFLITTSLPAGAAFTPANLEVVEDLNGNGRVDPGEPVIPQGGAISLAAGQAVSLLVTGTIPASALAGQSAQIVLTGTSSLQGATASNTDTLNATGGPSVAVTLASSTASSTPGAAFSLTASASNTGGAAASPAAVTVNGAAVTLFVLNLPVPANTTFVSAQATGGAGTEVLYHVLGTAADSYLSAAPAGAIIDAVAWALPSLAAGGTLAGQLNLTVNPNASGSLTAAASAAWTLQGALQSSASSTLVIRLPVIPPSIAYFTTAGYATPSVEAALGSPLYVQVNAAECNTDPTRVLTVPVTLTSRLTGDVEHFTATETAPNSGLFRIQPDVPTANAAGQPIAAGHGTLEVLRNDVVTATLANCGAVSATATSTLLIDPSGTAFNSHTNATVAGATVELIDVTGAGNGGNPGGPARVLQSNGASGAPATVVTAADGSYAFPIVAPSTYRLMVTPPGGYAFPSKLSPAQQPAGRVINPQGSYGGTFILTGSGPVRFDLPLDPSAASGGFLIQKTADRITAQLGDFVDYTIQLNNGSATALSHVVVSDLLPAGFVYVPGTARLNGAPLADPAGANGPALLFSLGTLASGAQPTLLYRVRVGVGAQGGTGVNTAQALSAGPQSNRASATVQVLGGVFSPDAYLFGKVYADCNGNGVQDPGEPGIPGVRIYLEDGTYAVTDEEGKYSLYGLTPRMHVAKVDLTTVPAGAALEVLNHRNALDPGSAFVDLTNGELYKTDFALTACTAALHEQIAARRKALTNPSEIQAAAGSLLTANPAAATSVDARTLPASGVIRLPGATAGDGASAGLPQASMSSAMPGIAPFAAPAAQLGAVGDPGGPYAPRAQGAPLPLNTPASELLQQQSPAPAAAAAGAPDEADFADLRALRARLQAEPLEKRLPELDSAVGFVFLTDGEVLTIDQATVQVKGPLGARFELTVNGRPVADTQVGKKSSLERTGVVAWEYIGVDLKPGRNVLRVRALDPFGNERGSAQITVLAPGALTRIVIDAPPRAVADAATAVPITVLLRDANGLPVAARTPLTLTASLGQWQQPGTAGGTALTLTSGAQTFVTGGEAHLLLLPPAQPGKAALGVASGALKATATLEFTPHLRPMIAAGLVSGTLNLRNLNPGALLPAQSGDVFETEIQSVQRSFDDGNGDVAARTALFLKGEVLGSTLLTLGYDSDKPSDTTLFRDIQPDQFYPVYGDSSARGFDAQSTGKLYVMVQNGTNFALYGDYSTQSDNPARQLTQYARALNGAQSRWQLGGATLDGFVSETSATQSVVEFRANGTSGPFQLDLNGVTNSQQVDIITRDRNQPAVILSDTPLTPFADYSIEPYTGLLLLKSPVASVDADLNPIYIHVNYSVDVGGPKHWVEGADARLPVTPGLTLGATAIHDADPANSFTLEGVNLLGKFAGTVATAEVARSSTDLEGDGSAERVDVKHQDATLETHLWGVHTDADFYNPSSLQSQGEAEYGVKAGYRLDEKDRLVAEGLKTSNTTTGAEQTGAELKVERSLPHNAKLEVGMRHSSANAEAVLSAPAVPGAATPLTPVVPVLPPAASPAGVSPEVGYTSARVKLTVPVPDVKGAEVFGLAEEAVDGSGGREDGVGGTYAVTSTTRIYAQHDFVDSLNGPYTLNPAISQYSTVAGISSALPDTTQLFDEYRVEDGLDGRSSEAAVGLRRLWKLPDGIGLTASVQRITPLSGVVTDQSSAVALGAEYSAAANWKASSQAQWQTSETSHSWLFTAGVARKLDTSWTLLERALYTQETDLAAGSGGRELATVQSGVAYRPVNTDVWNALGEVEYKRDFDTTLGPGLNLDERAWILAGNLNIQPTRGWEISARYAAEKGTDWADGLTDRSITQLAGARSTWDIAARWDAGVQGYTTWGDGSTENAVGVELGYLVWKNLRLSLGYNVMGFDAPDLAGAAYTQRGVYLHLDFKFDENLLGPAAAESRPTAVRSAAAGRLP
ncbi:MAG: SdrD B-like domain-containing protein [Steroidobacteraceae bacterium]